MRHPRNFIPVPGRSPSLTGFVTVSEAARRLCRLCNNTRGAIEVLHIPLHRIGQAEFITELEYEWLESSLKEVKRKPKTGASPPGEPPAPP
jgi:hypothetical protein